MQLTSACRLRGLELTMFMLSLSGTISPVCLTLKSLLCERTLREHTGAALPFDV